MCPLRAPNEEEIMPLSELEKNRLDQGREYRNVTMAVRAAENDEGRYMVEGYATTFNQPYELYSYDNVTVLEQVDARAFDGCDMTDVIMQYDHQGRVFARTRNNTLTIRVDAKGLYIAADLGGTEEGRKLYQEIKEGYTDRMSFGFIVETDERTTTRNHETGAITLLRTISKIKKLFDVSAVSMPANDMTSISARSLADGVIAGLAEERRLRESKRLKLKLLLEGI